MSARPTSGATEVAEARLDQPSPVGRIQTGARGVAEEGTTKQTPPGIPGRALDRAAWCCWAAT